MNWQIFLYETNRGEKPVEAFIRSLQSSTKAKIVHLIGLLTIYGNKLAMPHAKQITKDLYELRVRGKEEVRIFYFFSHKRIYLLHGFKKKTQKTPQKELQIALKRLLTLT